MSREKAETSKEKQGQAGTKWRHAGTMKEPAEPGRDKLGQGRFSVPAYPLLELLVPACP